MDNKDKIYLNYSKENGKNLQNVLRDKIALKRNSICNFCGVENNEGLYCKSCGKSLEEMKQVDKRQDLKYFKENMKSIVLTSMTSVFILFLISLGLKLFMSLSLGELINFINPLHIILGINLGTVNLNTATMTGSGSIGIHLGLLVIVLIPLFVLSVSNLIFIKNKNAKDVLYNSIGVGATYGLILVIISILSSTSFRLSDMINYGVSVIYRYKVFELFLNGFILGFISTYLVGYKKKYLGQNIYLDILKKAINTILVFYAVIFVILLGLTMLDRSYIYELNLYNYSSSNVFILSQLSSYILAFANIIPVTIGNNKLSVLSLLNGDLFFHTKIMFMAMIFLSLLVLILTGYTLRKKFKNTSSNLVLIFSIFYSTIMTILSSFSTVYMGGSMSLLKINSYQGNIFMGASALTTLIISFVYSYIIVKIGYTLSDFE